jgi:hypothetical protein
MDIHQVGQALLLLDGKTFFEGDKMIRSDLVSMRNVGRNKEGGEEVIVRSVEMEIIPFPYRMRS